MLSNRIDKYCLGLRKMFLKLWNIKFTVKLLATFSFIIFTSYKCKTYPLTFSYCVIKTFGTFGTYQYLIGLQKTFTPYLI